MEALGATASPQPAGTPSGLSPSVSGKAAHQAQGRAMSITRNPEALDDLFEALTWFLEDPRFQVAIGGNPTAVEEMLESARAALAKARGEA